MTRFATVALTFLLLLVGVVSADKPADKTATGKPHGAWKRDIGGDATLTLHFKHHELTMHLKKPDGDITAQTNYGITKDGVVYGIVTKVEKAGVDGPDVGDVFGFAVSISGDTLTLKDLRGNKVKEESKQHVEGEYKKVEDKKK